MLSGDGDLMYIVLDLFAKLISKTVLKNAATVIALTQTMKETMMDIYQRDVFVIPNGVDIKKLPRGIN